MQRLPKFLVGAVALLVVASTTVLADNPPQDNRSQGNSSASNRSGSGNASDTITVRGRIESISHERNQIVVTDQNRRDWTFHLGQNTRVQANNRDAQASDLQAGEEVQVTWRIQNNQMVASDIHAQGANRTAAGNRNDNQNRNEGRNQQAQNRNERGNQQQQASQTVRGQIQNVASDKHQIQLKDQNGREWTLQIGRDVKINVDGKEARVADLQQGQEVTVSYHAVLTDIRAGQDNSAAQSASSHEQTVRGKIENVAAGEHQLRIRDQNGRERTFHIGRDAQVIVNGQNSSLADLQQGQQVTATQHLVANDVRTGR